MDTQKEVLKTSDPIETKKAKRLKKVSGKILESGKKKRKSLKVIPIVETKGLIRESKYNYGKDVRTAMEKKKFRREARAQLKKFNEGIAKFKDSKKRSERDAARELIKEQKEWASKTYSQKV